MGTLLVFTANKQAGSTDYADKANDEKKPSAEIIAWYISSRHRDARVHPAGNSGLL
jgi:hypothetical protein